MLRKGGGEAVMGKKPAQECRNLEAAIHLCCVALAYIQENRRILELLKTGVLTEGI
jgi:hypothetical protein